MYIQVQLKDVLERIRAAEERCGRSAGSVRLVAVSKTFPAEDVARAVEAGQTVFGENRLQEAMEKMPLLPKGLEWHLIGPLQRNKVRKALQQGFALLHAVDSLRLAEAISRVAGELGVAAPILLEVNVDGEESKHGFSVEELRNEWDGIARLPHLDIRGLMAIPAPAESAEGVRPAFACLRHVRDELAARGPLPLPELSMGMSHDFEVAVEEGATMVRVGSLIFGKRDYAR
ncbi:YggS family pyridoxal phosphate-dependent enzyme [Akkermansia glycaniphila]|uniref:YggS family pyridoxal phosphate-dependent enzyme n=1 Tax=Akkermansia glycaniphila TaxID=1679444 RepID=UPI001C02485E|nr:YggS family pyridoxal phosphate-dependent enzyme [Akkermansia glycaniphila]MBT9450519.1 YggS family pyridoxal phosphate-dependent enzyme [Akkermansia glycaniphila]